MISPEGKKKRTYTIYIFIYYSFKKRSWSQAYENLTSSNCSVQVIGHSILGFILWREANLVDLKNNEAIESFYLFIWKVISVVISLNSVLYLFLRNIIFNLIQNLIKVFKIVISTLWHLHITRINLFCSYMVWSICWCPF